MTVARRRNGHAHKRAVPLAQRNTMLSTGGGGRHVVLDFTDLLMEASLPFAHQSDPGLWAGVALVVPRPPGAVR